MKILVLCLPFALLFSSCEAEEEVYNDDSLIIVHSRGDRYSIVSPTKNKVRYEVTPVDLNHQISARHLSYNSEKALLLAKEPSNTYVKLIYSCDMKTGENLQQVTTMQWDVQSFDAARTKPAIVLHTHPAPGGADDSHIYSINVDGTNVQQLTTKHELVGDVKLIYHAFPSWSPNGQQIAFRGTMRTQDPGAYWWGRSIIVMDANGSNKRILFNDPESGDHRDISWTRDGKFLVFLTTESSSTPKNRVKVIRVEDGHIIDITQNLLVDGLHTTNLCVSPVCNTILFNKYQPGGGDLHQISYEITEEGDFQIVGNWKMKCKVQSGGLQFGAPRWQHYIEK